MASIVGVFKPAGHVIENDVQENSAAPYQQLMHLIVLQPVFSVPLPDPRTLGLLPVGLTGTNHELPELLPNIAIPPGTQLRPPSPFGGASDSNGLPDVLDTLGGIGSGRRMLQTEAASQGDSDLVL